MELQRAQPQDIGNGHHDGGLAAAADPEPCACLLVHDAHPTLTGLFTLDATIVNVALTDVQRALGFSGTGLEWVVNAYALTFGGLLLLGGRAAPRTRLR